MRAYVAPETQTLRCDYDVRIRNGKPLDEGRAFLKSRIGAPLLAFGLAPTAETVEEWGGQVITQRYQGQVPDAARAAEAIRFICEGSESVLDLSAEE
jgi:hypothetical protein